MTILKSARLFVDNTNLGFEDDTLGGPVNQEDLSHDMDLISIIRLVDETLSQVVCTGRGAVHSSNSLGFEDYWVGGPTSQEMDLSKILRLIDEPSSQVVCTVQSSRLKTSVSKKPLEMTKLDSGISMSIDTLSNRQPENINVIDDLTSNGSDTVEQSPSVHSSWRSLHLFPGHTDYISFAVKESSIALTKS